MPQSRSPQSKLCRTRSRIAASHDEQPWEEQGIELHPDAWERFERTVDTVAKAPPTRKIGFRVAALTLGT